MIVTPRCRQLAAALLFATSVPVAVPSHAAMVSVVMQATAAPSYGAFGTSAPFLGLTAAFTVFATFTFDDTTGMQFGNPNCSFGSSSSPCVGYGFEVKDLSVAINGVIDPTWYSGASNNSFFSGGVLDVRGRGFFTPSNGVSTGGPLGPGEISTAWLPLLNSGDPNVAMNFGQMYANVDGGVSFTPFFFTAQDAQRNYASGFTGASATSPSAVPLPPAAILLASGLALFVGLGSVKRTRLLAANSSPIEPTLPASKRWSQQAI